MVNIINKVKVKFIKIGTHPLVSAAAAVLSILAGAIASFFTPSLRSSFGFPADPARGNGIQVENLHLSSESAIFCGLVLLPLFLFAWSKYADSQSSKEATDNLNAVLDSLKTMPQADFLKSYHSKLGETQSSLLATIISKSTNTPSTPAFLDGIESEIRFNLGTIISLAQKFKGIHGEIGANIMIFDQTWDKVVIDIPLDESRIAPANHDGFLLLNPKLSTSTHSPGKPDPSLKAIGLPVHKKEQNSKDGRTNVLPGAPLCFYTKEYTYCENIPELLEKMRSNFRDQNQTVKLAEYFETGAGKNIKSFACIPLALPAAPNGAIAVHYGVLNIHCSEPDFLPRGGELFSPMISTFAVQISILLAMR